MKGPRQCFDFGRYLVDEPRHKRARFTSGLWGPVAAAEPKKPATRQSMIHGAAP
jgi:hypothetical protein